MRSNLVKALALACCVVASGFGAAEAASADVTVEEETKMGGFMKIVTFGRGMKTKTFISGDRMRTETGDEVQIVDLGEEAIYDLNEKKKTYTVTTFEEMREQREAAMAKARGKHAEAADSEGGKETPEVTTSANVSVTETGRTEDIKGFDAKQYLMELDVTVTDEEEQESGTLSTVTETWLARDVPGFDEMQAFYRKMAEKLGTTSLGRRIAGDEDEARQFGQGMQRMADEMKKLDGFSLRSVFYFGSPEAAKREARGEKKEGGGLGGMFKKMKPFGNDESEEGAEGQEGEGAVLMKFETEVKKIETKSLDQDLFTMPEGYRLVEQP